jgi:hypothetical protein
MKRVASISTATVLLSLVVFAKPLTIVEEGERRAVIVVASGESHAEQAAAAIRDYIEKISGAALEILEETATGARAAEPVHIYVGHTVAAANAGIEIPSGFDPSIRPDTFEEEGYVLRTKGNAIFVGGNSDGPYRGTLYGAYAFLEMLGCRWYFPGEWGEVIPPQTTLVVPDLDIVSRPDFPVRHASIGGWSVPTTSDEMKQYDEWCTKLGFDIPAQRLYPIVGDGFLGLILPPAEYFDAHPEYFAMDEKGQRWSGLSKNANSEYYTMLCLSNPDVFAESLKNLQEAFRDEEKGRRLRISPNGFGISPPDGSAPCHCERCLNVSPSFYYPAYAHRRLLMMSELFFNFASRLAMEFPDKFVATMAYSLHEMPPQGVTLPPNMAVMQTPRFCCALHPNGHPTCWRRLEFVRMLKQWRRQTPHLYLYEYNPNFLEGLFLPERGTANAAVNVPLYQEVDIKGSSAEGRKAFMQTWITYYVTARLLWDATTDVDALKAELYATFFGKEAGPHVQSWWDACEAAMLGARHHGHLAVQTLSSIYTTEFVAGLRVFVDAALNSEVTEKQRSRVKAFALIADHLKAFTEMQEAHMGLRFQDAVAAAERMLEAKRKLHEISPFLIALNQRDPPIASFTRGQKQKYEELASMVGGEKGEIVAPLPLEMRFLRDRFNEGVINEWYLPGFDDRRWDVKNTFFNWDQQDEPESNRGHDYDGYGWYRGKFRIPARYKGKVIHFWCGGAVNEAWVWVNGRYAGHQSHTPGWWPPHDFNMDITRLVKPGTENTITIRVWNDAELGGLYGRGFFWSPIQ